MMKASALEDKTERILRLKEFERNNKSRMNTISGIMGYAQYADESVNGDHAKKQYLKSGTDSQEESDRENQTKEFKSTFKVRLIFCLLLSGFMFADRFFLHSLSDNLYEKAKKEIQLDYSDGIIDFIDELPYTLGYEETGIN